MLLDRLRIGSRSTLLSLAFCGLLVSYASDVLPLARTVRITMGLAGSVVLMYVTLNLTSLWSDHVKGSLRARIFVALCAVSSIALVLISRMLPIHSWPHVVLSVSGCMLCFICWSMPRSGWQTVPFLAFYLLTLMGLRWNQFRIFASVSPFILIAMTSAWLLISLVAFRILDRRRTTTTQLL